MTTPSHAAADQIVYDELGPETVLKTYDPATDTHGILVIDNTVLGPTGGGCRMAPDVSPNEVARLARAMTYKFAIVGFPRGGCKSGIIGNPAVDVTTKAARMASFGRGVAAYLADSLAAIGPDMGVTVKDVSDVYNAAGVRQLRSGLFETVVDGDPAGYHLTGFGVMTALKSAAKHANIDLTGKTLALEGFGQVGVGAARYAQQTGVKIVAVSTREGCLYNDKGLDVARLMELRRKHGDTCILEYKGAELIPSPDIYYLPVDVLVPGALPDVIRADNVGRVQARLVACAGNLALTNEAEELLHARGVLVLPDILASAGAAIASWVDFLSGSFPQATAAIDHIMSRTTREVLSESQKRGTSPHRAATASVRERILAQRGKRRVTFEESKEQIRKLVGLA